MIELKPELGSIFQVFQKMERDRFERSGDTERSGKPERYVCAGPPEYSGFGKRKVLASFSKDAFVVVHRGGGTITVISGLPPKEMARKYVAEYFPGVRSDDIDYAIAERHLNSPEPFRPPEQFIVLVEKEKAEKTHKE